MVLTHSLTHIHLLIDIFTCSFRCLKDLAWNRDNIVMWFLFLIPTVLLACDLLWLSYHTEDVTIHTTHYFSSLLWILGNACWAFGEFFFDKYDEPLVMWHLSDDSLYTLRWYSAWILTSSLFPVIIMYVVWIYLTKNKLFSVIESKKSRREVSRGNYIMIPGGDSNQGEEFDL